MHALRQGKALLRSRACFTRGWSAVLVGGAQTSSDHYRYFQPTLRDVTALHRRAAAVGGPVRSLLSYDNIRPTVYSGIRPPDRTQHQGNWCKSPDQYDDYAKFLDEPVPSHLQPYLPAIESFVVDTWLPTFPSGARLRRLQRDLAFRMLPIEQRPPDKLLYEELATVVGHLQRRGVLKTAAGRSGRMILYHVDAEITYYKYRREHDPNYETSNKKRRQRNKKKLPTW